MTGRIQTLDGIRGYAALAVLVYHSILALDTALIERVLYKPAYDLSSAYDLWAKFWLTAFSGESAVILFFLLSGCVLILSLDKDFGRFPPWRASIAFTVRRVLRIYPAVIACVLAMVGAVWLHAQFVPSTGFPYDMDAVLNNVVLYSPDVNGATWTLLVEMLAVPFLIAAGFLMHRWGWPALLGFLVFAVAIRHQSWLVFGSEWTAMHLYYFALGCMVPYGVGRAAARLGARLGWLPLLVGFVFIRPLLLPGSTGQFVQAAFGFMFMSLVYHQSPARLAAFLTRPVSQFLGRVSYGFYLWNVLLVVLLARTAGTAPDFFARHAVEIGLLVSIPFAVLTAVIADLSDRFIEQPGIRLGRWVSRRILAQEVRPAAEPLQVERAGV